jgi:hypothetical protein
MGFKNLVAALFLVINAIALHDFPILHFLNFSDLPGDRLVAWSVFITGALIIWCLPLDPRKQ